MENKNKIFESVYGEYKNQIFLFALGKTNSREDALDITANTFMAFWESLENFENRSSYKTWLFAICRNKINDFYRKHYRDQDMFDHSFDISDYKEEELIDNSDNSLVNRFGLQELLNLLKDGERELMLLRYMNNLNYGECAQVLNITETSARVSHHRILNKLKKQLIN